MKRRSSTHTGHVDLKVLKGLLLWVRKYGAKTGRGQLLLSRTHSDYSAENSMEKTGAGEEVGKSGTNESFRIDMSITLPGWWAVKTVEVTGFYTLIEDGLDSIPWWTKAEVWERGAEEDTSDFGLHKENGGAALHRFGEDSSGDIGEDNNALQTLSIRDAMFRCALEFPNEECYHYAVMN